MKKRQNVNINKDHFSNFTQLKKNSKYSSEKQTFNWMPVVKFHNSELTISDEQKCKKKRRTYI